MKIQIEENLFIESDSLQFLIKEYSGKKDKKGYAEYNVHGYFVSLAQAVKHLVKMKIKESTAKTLGELLKDIKRIEAYIESRINI